MCSNPAEIGAAVVRQQGRSWSLVARLAFFYTLGAAALLLVTMAILYGVVVQHIDADDNTFLIDKLRAARADLDDKKASNGGLLADEVPIETADYFMRVLDRQTGQVLAERPEKGERLRRENDSRRRCFLRLRWTARFLRKASNIRAPLETGFS